MGGTIYLFTNQFPYGDGEAFIETEIKILSQRFDKIYLVPYSVKGQSRTIPSNAKVIDLFRDYSYSRSILFTEFVLFVRIMVKEFLNQPDRSEFIKRFSFLKSALLQALSRARWISNSLTMNNQHDVYYYSYWLDDWASILSVLKFSKKISGFFSRAHRFDLYNELWPGNLIPFRSFQIDQVDRVFLISKDGAEYLKKRFPTYGNKFDISYLGVNDMGTNKKVPGSEFTIVSCSFAVPVKRIEIIIEALKRITFNTRWIHFGGGNSLADLQNRAEGLPANVRAEFKGTLPNEKVLEFYRNNTVDLFVNTSSSEGLPVSIQEAISFGIPVAATNVGGVAEIVNKQTGYLLDADLSPEMLAGVFIHVHASDDKMHEFRIGVRRFWEENFNAEKNYNEFCDRIIEQSI